MIKRTLTVADYFLIAANLLPVAGVLFWNWDPGEIFIIYCLETVIIGIFNLIKMAIAGAYQKQNLWYNQGKAIPMPAIFFMLFFYCALWIICCRSNRHFYPGIRDRPVEWLL